MRQIDREISQLARKKYGITGKALLAKLEKGESGGDGDAVSSAGARAWFQFMPGTRDAVLKHTKGKVDPWRSRKEARHAAKLHLTGKLGHEKGLEGYNPGGGEEYVRYILDQKVGDVSKAARSKSSKSGKKPSRGGESRPTEDGRLRLIPGETRHRAEETTQVDVESAAIDALLAGSRRKGSLFNDLNRRLDSGAYTTTTVKQVPEGGVPRLEFEPGKEQRPKSRDKGQKKGSSSLDDVFQLSGGFEGTQGVAQRLADEGLDLGLKVVSTKRDNTNPYSGDRSDHDNGNEDAYAYDISNGSQPTEEMDRAAFRIARKLGIDDYVMGHAINRTVQHNGVRVQIIYRGDGPEFGGNHMNHIHIGVKNVRGGGKRDRGVVKKGR